MTRQPTAGATRLLLAMLVLAVLGPPAVGAPALKDKAPPGETVVGHLVYLEGDPVVELGGDEPVVYWLVFARPETEARLDAIAAGTRVRVVGRLAAGGQYRYVIVSAIDKD